MMIRAGDWGTYPANSQSVAVHYDAFLPDGSRWDSSRERGRPLRFRLGIGQVIPGLDEGVAQLSLGSRARMTIPSELACECGTRPSALFVSHFTLPACLR
jgi:FK506-binding protein 1